MELGSPTRKKIFIFIIIVFFLALVSISLHLYLFGNKKPLQQTPENQQGITHPPCLLDNEIADFDYDVDLYNNRGVKIPNKATTTIYVKNKNTGQEIYRFRIYNVRTNADTLEVHRCGVYVIRNFDLDVKKGLFKTHELWRYTYDGKGEILMNSEMLRPYSLYVRVDFSETYIALEQYHLGHPEHAVVVKNLRSPKLDNVFILRPSDIWQKFPQLNQERRIGVVGWTKDGKYLWGGSESQTDYVYFRFNIENKNLDVFVMPEDAVHYGPPRVDTGYIWYIYGPPWVGIHEIAQEIYEEWQKEGKKVSLFLYNLFTKEKITLAVVDDPAWDFKPKWLSDTELEYYLPSGEKKVFKVE